MKINDGEYKKRREYEGCVAKNQSIGEVIRRAVYGRSIDYSNNSVRIIYAKNTWLCISLFGVFLSLIFLLCISDFIELLGVTVALVLFILFFVGVASSIMVGVIGLFTHPVVVVRFVVDGNKVIITTSDIDFVRRLKESDIGSRLKNFDIILVVK